MSSKYVNSNQIKRKCQISTRSRTTIWYPGQCSTIMKQLINIDLISKLSTNLALQEQERPLRLTASYMGRRLTAPDWANYIIQHILMHNDGYYLCVLGGCAVGCLSRDLHGYTVCLPPPHRAVGVASVGDGLYRGVGAQRGGRTGHGGCARLHDLRNGRRPRLRDESRLSIFKLRRGDRDRLHVRS